MKKHLFISMAIVSMLCLSGCQTNDDDQKDGKVTMEDKDNKPAAEDKILAENEVFKVTSIVKKETVNNVIEVEGKASVFEAMFKYRLEDGHNVLAEGSVMADKGAPDWGNFKIKISHNHASSPNGVLTIYVASAKDGTAEHELNIPVEFTNYE